MKKIHHINILELHKAYTEEKTMSIKDISEITGRSYDSIRKRKGVFKGSNGKRFSVEEAACFISDAYYIEGKKSVFFERYVNDLNTLSENVSNENDIQLGKRLNEEYFQGPFNAVEDNVHIALNNINIFKEFWNRSIHDNLDKINFMDYVNSGWGKENMEAQTEPKQKFESPSCNIDDTFFELLYNKFLSRRAIFLEKNKKKSRFSISESEEKNISLIFQDFRNFLVNLKFYNGLKMKRLFTVKCIMKKNKTCCGELIKKHTPECRKNRTKKTLEEIYEMEENKGFCCVQSGNFDPNWKTNLDLANYYPLTIKDRYHITDEGAYLLERFSFRSTGLLEMTTKYKRSADLYRLFREFPNGYNEILSEASTSTGLDAGIDEAHREAALAEEEEYYYQSKEEDENSYDLYEEEDSEDDDEFGDIDFSAKQKKLRYQKRLITSFKHLDKYRDYEILFLFSLLSYLIFAIDNEYDSSIWNVMDELIKKFKSTKLPKKVSCFFENGGPADQLLGLCKDRNPQSINEICELLNI